MHGWQSLWWSMVEVDAGSYCVCVLDRGALLRANEVTSQQTVIIFPIDFGNDILYEVRTDVLRLRYVRYYYDAAKYSWLRNRPYLIVSRLNLQGIHDRNA